MSISSESARKLFQFHKNNRGHEKWKVTEYKGSGHQKYDEINNSNIWELVLWEIILNINRQGLCFKITYEKHKATIKEFCFLLIEVPEK